MVNRFVTKMVDHSSMCKEKVSYMNKGEAYANLVKDSQARYRMQSDEASFLIPLDEDFGICNEINLYTYWQGLGYADGTPEIKYLLVGQDWGDPAYVPASFWDRIRAINSGQEQPYIDEQGGDTVFRTDRNLIELFRQLGYGEGDMPSIAEKRYSELFFTNFCLGYRRKKSSRGMTKKLMKDDMESFQTLCTILQPKNILCLGRLTFDCVYKALVKGKRIPYKGYMKYIGENQETKADADYGGGRIHPLAHCGGLGTRNRPLAMQIEDWKQVHIHAMR